MNEHQIADIWMLFKDFMDRKVYEAAAERYVELLSDHSVSDKQLEDTMGFDHALDSAITYYLGTDSDSDIDEEELDSWDDE